MNIEHVHPVGKDLDRVGAGEHTPIERAAPGLINREIQLSRIANGFDTNRWQGQWFCSPPQKSVDQWTGLPAWPVTTMRAPLRSCSGPFQPCHFKFKDLAWEVFPTSACKHAAISAA